MSGGRVTLRFGADELEALDAARGDASRGVFAKSAVLEAAAVANAGSAPAHRRSSRPSRGSSDRASGKDPAARVSHVQEASSAGSRPVPAERPPSSAGAQVAELEPRRALVDVMVERGWSVSLAARAVRLGQVKVTPAGERATDVRQLVRASQVRVVA